MDNIGQTKMKYTSFFKTRLDC